MLVSGLDVVLPLVLASPLAPAWASPLLLDGPQPQRRPVASISGDGAGDGGAGAAPPQPRTASSRATATSGRARGPKVGAKRATTTAGMVHGASWAGSREEGPGKLTPSAGAVTLTDVAPQPGAYASDVGELLVARPPLTLTGCGGGRTLDKAGRLCCNSRPRMCMGNRGR